MRPFIFKRPTTHDQYLRIGFPAVTFREQKVRVVNVAFGQLPQGHKRLCIADDANPVFPGHDRHDRASLFVFPAILAAHVKVKSLVAMLCMR